MTARHRLLPPPRPFVGREREVAWLGAAIERAPVAAVWGPGGIGKTALALHTIHARGNTEHAIRVSLRGLDPARDVHLEVLLALAEAQQLTRIDWAGLAGDVDSLTAALIDLAEEADQEPPKASADQPGGVRADGAAGPRTTTTEAPFLVLLDDLHHADRAQVRDLLLQLARYARRSRWIAIGRDELSIAELPGQVLRLGPMQESELREVAAAIAPDASGDTVRAAVDRAAGSPWTLQQVLSSGAAPESSVEVLDDLDEETSELLRTLALLDTAVPLVAIAGALAGAPSAEQMAALVRRGLIEQSDEGIAVHDVVRDDLRGSQRDRTRIETVARALAASGDDGATIEGIRLLGSVGAMDTIGDILDARGETLLESGHAPRLLIDLESATAPRLVRFRQRCALEVGDLRALRAAQWIESDRLEDRLHWARILLARGDVADALEVAREVAGGGDADAGLRHDATMLAASCLEKLGRAGEALRLLRAHEPADREASLHRDVVVTACLRLEGSVDEARTRVRELEKALSRRKGEAHAGSVLALAHVAFELGMLSETKRLLGQLEARSDRGSAALSEGRRALLLNAAIALLECDLGRATEALDRLEPYVQRASALRARVRLGRCTARLLAGDFDGYEEALAAAVQDARQVHHPDALAVANALSYQWAALEALPAPALPGVDRDGAARPDLARYAELERLRHSARAGDAAGSDVEVDETPEDAHAGLGSLRLVVRALRRFLPPSAAGIAALASARDDAAAAVDVAHRSGHTARELEARHVLCEILAIRGDHAALAREADTLLELAEGRESARMATEARFFGAIASRRISDPAVLEPVASADRVAPVAARRARAILAGRPRLDAVDRTLLDALRARGEHPRVELVQPLPDEPTPWEPGWGIDERKSALWLEDGTPVDLSHRRLLVKLLVALADSGGEASKEHLVLTVWDEPEYHPLHHDNRLHSAVRKLRRIIERDPAEPRRLLTTEAGYALGAPTRRVRE